MYYINIIFLNNYKMIWKNTISERENEQTNKLGLFQEWLNVL